MTDIINRATAKAKAKTTNSISSVAEVVSVQKEEIKSSAKKLSDFPLDASAEIILAQIKAEVQEQLSIKIKDIFNKKEDEINKIKNIISEIKNLNQIRIAAATADRKLLLKNAVDLSLKRLEEEKVKIIKEHIQKGVDAFFFKIEKVSNDFNKLPEVPKIPSIPFKNDRKL
jgi:hypothetical protein